MPFHIDTNNGKYPFAWGKKSPSQYGLFFPSDSSVLSFGLAFSSRPSSCILTHKILIASIWINEMLLKAQHNLSTEYHKNIFILQCSSIFFSEKRTCLSWYVLLHPRLWYFAFCGPSTCFCYWDLRRGGGGGLVQSEPFNQSGKECYFHGFSEVWLAGREGELIH